MTLECIDIRFRAVEHAEVWCDYLPFACGAANRSAQGLGEVGRASPMIGRNIPELQKASGHVFAVFAALLGNVDAGLVPSQGGGRVRDSGVIVARTTFGR